jgi:hypothetical protein
VALAAVAIPVVGFTLACVPVGCGDGEGAPREVRSQEQDPIYDPVEPRVDDSGLRGFEVCAGAAGVTLLDQGGEPLPDSVDLDYRGGCGSDGAVWLDVVPSGLVSGAIDVAWTLSVDGFDPLTREATWELGCTTDGMEHGVISIDLPADADGAAVTIDVVLMDAEGTEASASHTFVAWVSEG